MSEYGIMIVHKTRNFSQNQKALHNNSKGKEYKCFRVAGYMYIHMYMYIYVFLLEKWSMVGLENLCPCLSNTSFIILSPFHILRFVFFFYLIHHSWSRSRQIETYATGIFTSQDRFTWQGSRVTLDLLILSIPLWKTSRTPILNTRWDLICYVQGRYQEVLCGPIWTRSELRKAVPQKENEIEEDFCKKYWREGSLMKWAPGPG